MSNSDGSEEMLDNAELSDDNYVTYIIGEGTEIVIHRFKIELEDGQDIEAVIKQLDDEMEAMHGQIRFRMDWNYAFVQWIIANDRNQRFCFRSYYLHNKNLKWKWYYSWREAGLAKVEKCEVGKFLFKNLENIGEVGKLIIKCDVLFFPTDLSNFNSSFQASIKNFLTSTITFQRQFFFPDFARLFQLTLSNFITNSPT